MTIRTPIGKYDADILIAETGLCKKPSRKDISKVLVDGKIYPSVQVAAERLGMLRTTLRKALINGESIPGHEVKYCEE